MTCPICARPSVESFRPFCSARCADVDLARWFSGAYRVPAETDEAEDAGHLEASPDDTKPH